MAASPKADAKSAPDSEPKEAKESDTIRQTQTPVADPMVFKPDPLPPLNRPIFEPPGQHRTHLTLLHPADFNPALDAAVEDIRTRLGEMREALKRFPHEIGGELGDLISYLRNALVAHRPDPERDARRENEDAAVVLRRRSEDQITPPSPAVVDRRRAEDAGRDEMRRIQDTSV